jgi:tRNA(fMet)-specific endonuclease VapC
VKYLLDTDHISILQLRVGPEYAALAARIALHSAADLAFSVISFHEQVLGAHAFIGRARSASHLVRGYSLLGEILQGFSAAPVLPFDAAAAATFDTLRAQRIRVATMDLRIASIALSHGLVLLTRNVSDFGRIPGLVTDDWTP